MLLKKKDHRCRFLHSSLNLSESNISPIGIPSQPIATHATCNSGFDKAMLQSLADLMQQLKIQIPRSNEVFLLMTRDPRLEVLSFPLMLPLAHLATWKRHEPIQTE